MKVKLTTTLDYITKKNMEIVLARQSIGWTDVIQLMSVEYLKEHDPKACLEIEFNAGEEKLSSLRSEVRDTEEHLQRLQIEIVDFKTLPNLTLPNNEDELLGAQREGFFQSNKEHILDRFAKGTQGTMSFKAFTTKGGFANEKDAYKWLVKRVAEEKQTISHYTGDK